MLVTILKFLGLSAGKSLQSPASPDSVRAPKAGITAHRSELGGNTDHGVASQARRNKVKAPVKKPVPVKKITPTKGVKKPAAKVVKPAKPAKVAVKTKAKVMRKPVAKTKALVKKPSPGGKTIVAVKKPVRSAAPKAAPKSVPKPAAKTKPKTTPKTAPKKMPSKSLAKSPPVKAKIPVKVAVKSVKKPVKLSVNIAPSKSKSAKPVTSVKAVAIKKQAPHKPVAVKPSPKALAAKPVAKAIAPVALASQAKLTAVPVPAPVKAVRTSKSGFISPANIAPLAMAVSTAAKTSFIKATVVLAPPPQHVVHKDPKLVNNWKTKTAVQLSDAEVIAMPEAQYMGDKQLAFFRLKLLQLKRDILSNAGATTEHLREDTSTVPDPADRATIEEEHALELRTRDRERKLLKKIEQSIARIDAEDYGYCDETGEAIGVARLIARPTATLSLEAQQRRELKQKMFGD